MADTIEEIFNIGLPSNDNINLSQTSTQDIDVEKLFAEGFEEVTPQTDFARIHGGDISEFDQQFIPTGGLEALRRERAIAQSTGEQISNTVIKLLPSIGLGIIENAGYLLEIPNVIAGDTQDFSNPITEFAKKNRKGLEEEFPVFREDPKEVFDLTDIAWWIQHGAGLVESIGEFLATGIGVGSALGKTASAISKSLNLGARAATGVQATAQGLTAASLAYTEGAMSGAQIYQETLIDAKRRGLTDSEANQLASKAASKTVALNTVINTALNVTSVAPLFSRNINKTAKLKTNRLKDETIPEYKARLIKISDDPLNGFRPNTKQVIIREILQEGLEEEVNLFAEQEGRLEAGLITEERAGGKNPLDRFLKSSFTEEGALNFLLGAIGGAGQTGGIALLTRESRQIDLDQIEAERVANVKNIQNTFDQIREKQLELQTEASKDSPNPQTISDLKDELFDINTIYHFQKGTEDALVGTLQQIRDVDNIIDLGDQLQPQIDTIIQQGSDLVAQKEILEQQEQTPEVKAQLADVEIQLSQLKNNLETIQNQKLSLIGKTEAMQQGLAEDKSDNRYKKTASEKIEDLTKYKERYNKLSFQFNNTPETQLVDIAAQILDKEINNDRFTKTLDDVNSRLGVIKSFTNTEVTSITKDEFVNNLLLLEGKLEALEKVKQKSISKENLDKINREIVETQFQVDELRANDQELEGDSIDTKIKKISNKDEIVNNYSNIQEEIIDTENLRDDNERNRQAIIDNPQQITEEFQTELKKINKKREETDNNKVNTQRKEQQRVDEQGRVSSEVLINNASSNEELNVILDQLDVEGIATPDLIDRINRRRQQLEVAPLGEVPLVQEEIELPKEVEIPEENNDIPDSYVEDESFTKNPTKDVEIKEREENDLGNVKIVEAAKSIAYRVKSFKVEDGVKKTDSNELEVDLPRGILVENNYKEGDVVIVEVDREFDKEIEGVRINIDIFNNDPLLLPMKIIHEETGETIGFLHDINYMNENSVADGDQFAGNIEKQKQIISEFRNKIIDTGGSLKTTLDNIRGGWILSTNRIKNKEGNFLRPSSEVFTNSNLRFGVIGLTENGIQSIGSDVETRNSTEFISNNEGKVVVLLPDVKGDLLAAPLTINKLDELSNNTISNAIELFFKPNLTDNDKKVVEDIKNQTNENITNAKGLQSFIEKYLLVTSLNDEKSNEIRDNGIDSRRHYIGITKNRISIQQDRRSRVDFEKGKELTTNEIQRLKTHLDSMYFNVDDKLIGDKNHISPILSKNDEGIYTYNQNQGFYTDYIKDISRTNLHENQFNYKGETHYSYFDNPIYEINLDVEVTSKNIVSNQDVEINKEAPKKRKKTRRQQLLEDKYSEQNDIIEKSKDDNISQSPIIIDDDEFTENDRLREALTTQLSSSFTPKQLNDIINTGFGEVLTEMVGGSTIDEAFEAWNEYIEDSAEDHTYEYQDRFIAVRDNLNQINETIRVELTKIRTEILKSDEEIGDEDGVEDKESVSEQAFSDSDAIWREDNKFKSSERMKIFLLMVSDVEITYRKGEGNQLIPEHIPVSNYLDSTNLIPIDQSFNALKELLADKGNDFDDMMEVLRKEENNIGWLQDVRKNFNEAYIKKLGLEDIDQLKNEFVKLMSNSNFIFKTALFSRNQTGNIETQLINTDRISSFRRTLIGWIDGIKNTNLYNNIQGSYILNKESVQSSIDWYDKNVLKNPNKKDLNLVKTAKSWLKLFGIKVSNRSLVEIINSGKQEPINKFTSSKGFFRIFYNELQKSLKSEGGFVESNPLINNNSIIELARTDTKNSNSVHSSSFKNGEGNTVNSINQNRNITQRLNKLTNNKTYAKNLLKVPFLKPTKFYQTVLEKFSEGNSKIIKGVNLSVFDTLNQKNRNIKGTPLNEQTAREIEASKIINFLDTGDFIKEGEIFFNYTHLVPSKSTAFLIRLPKEKVETLVSGDTQLTLNSLNKLYSIVLSEIDRMNTYTKTINAEGNNSKIEGYKPDVFYFFQGLNNIVDSNGNSLILNGRVELTNELEEIIKNHIQEQFTAMVNDKKSIWERHNIIKEKGVEFIPFSFGTVKNIDDFVIDYVYNDILGNFNIHQMFIGDPALFVKEGVNSTWDNISKRLVKDQAPGTDFARDKENTSYIQLAIADIKLDSLNIDNLSEEYKNIEITDAQEFITVREGLLNLLHSGNITKNSFDKTIVQYEKDGSTPNIAGLFQPQKPIYSGKRVHKSLEGVILAEVQDYVKSSAVVLTKDLTQGTSLDNLRKLMEKLEKDKNLPVRASFKSANKLGEGRPLVISDEEGNIIDNVEVKSINYVLHERVNLRNQQDIPYDKNKDKTVDGSQQRKLIQYTVSNIKSSFFLQDFEIGL